MGAGPNDFGSRVSTMIRWFIRDEAESEGFLERFSEAWQWWYIGSHVCHPAALVARRAEMKIREEDEKQ